MLKIVDICFIISLFYITGSAMKQTVRQQIIILSHTGDPWE